MTDIISIDFNFDLFYGDAIVYLSSTNINPDENEHNQTFILSE